MSDPRQEKLLEQCRVARTTMEEIVIDMQAGRSKIGRGEGMATHDHTEEAIAFYTAKMNSLDRLISELEAKHT